MSSTITTITIISVVKAPPKVVPIMIKSVSEVVGPGFWALTDGVGVIVEGKITAVVLPGVISGVGSFAVCGVGLRSTVVVILLDRPVVRTVLL